MIARQLSLASQSGVPRYRLSLVRETTDEYDTQAPLSDPAQLAAWLWERIFSSEPRECLVVVYFDARSRVIGWTVAYTGGTAQCTAEPRGILAPAMLANAEAIALAHNHPSGDPSPSRDDLAFTRRIADGGELLGIRLLDHLVIGSAKRWTSIRRMGGW